MAITGNKTNQNKKEELQNQLVDMGWDQVSVSKALQQANYNREQAVEILLNQKAVQQFLSTSHISPDNRLRITDCPVGLKNVGNTCYVNSLLQIYFHIPPLIRNLFTHTSQIDIGQGATKSQQECSELIIQMIKLFSRMVLSEKKYVDPLSALKHVVDENGNHVGIGEQQDVGEYNINLLGRLEEGLTNKKKMQEHSIKNSLQISKGANFPAERGIIESIFFGTLKEIITSQEQDGAQICLIQEVDFAQIILDINNKDLYTAWYHYMHDQIDTFTTPLDFRTQATQEAWILNVPPVLLFQLQRVIFDIKTNNPLKLHDQFEFPKIIYPDRFMYSNCQKIQHAYERTLQISVQIENLENKLQQLKNYNSSGLSLEQLLIQTCSFLQEQQEDYQIVHSINKSNHIVLNPNCLEQIEDQQKNQIIQSQLLLKSYIENIKTQIQHLEEELSTLRKQENSPFECEEFMQLEYQLHSIIMHEGEAGQGHYFAYIRDFHEDKWRLFNDMFVSEVSEEQVMGDATGRQNKSAYCLIYLNQQEIKSWNSQNLTQYYMSVMKEQEKTSTFDENLKFKKEMYESKIQSQIRQILELYQQRQAQLQGFSQQSQFQTQKSDLQIDLINFSIFLKVNFQSENLSRWQIMDTCVRQIDSEHRGLQELNKSELLFIRLKQQLGQLKQQGPRNLELTQYETEQLYSSLEAYGNNMNDAAYALSIITYINQQQ